MCSCVYLVRYLESTWFIWVSQMNHIPMNIDYDKNKDWVSTQVRISFLLETLSVVLNYRTKIVLFFS